MGLEEIINLLKDFVPVYLLFAIIFGIGALFLYYVPLSALSIFVASKGNFFGTITSVFVNADWYNYLQEMSGFVGAGILLILSNAFLPSSERIKRAKFFTISSFVLGIIATGIWDYLPHPVNVYFSYGPSGISFAQMGILTAWAFTNIILLPNELKQNKRLAGIRLASLALNLAIPLGFTFYILFVPSGFFNITKGVNYLLHEISFLLGFVSAIIYTRSVLLSSRN